MFGDVNTDFIQPSKVLVQLAEALAIWRSATNGDSRLVDHLSARIINIADGPVCSCGVAIELCKCDGEKARFGVLPLEA